MTLKTLSIALGVAVSVPQVFGILNPRSFAAAARKFPRNVPIGIALMLFGTAWFIWNLNQESISDFNVYKLPMMVAFAAIGIGVCVFVQDFIAVRGLAVVLLLLAKLMVDTGRPMLPVTSWALVIQIWAYVLILSAMWLTISPWRMRDIVNWGTATEERVRAIAAVRLAFGLFLVVLGLTKF